MSKQIVALGALSASLVLVACGGNGGGGGDGAQTNGGATNVAVGNTNANAEGAWHSEQSNGDVLDLLLLENGSLYALSSSTATSAPLLAFDQGSYTVTGTNLTAQLTHYNDLGTTLTGSVSGTVVAGISIAGTATTTGSAKTPTFSVKPTSVADNSYNYNNAASLSSIAGAWVSGTLLFQSAPVSFSIDSAGALAGTNLACSFTGQFLPRASGKNVFDVSLTFGQAPCAAPGKTFSGVAISYIGSNGTRQLTAALQDASKALGTMLYAQR